MTAYEYRAIPAPRRGKSDKGVKGTSAKFANAITHLMNEMGADGWEYLRADTLPCEERQGLTSKTVKYHSMLVFRRALDGDAPEEDTLALPSPEDMEDDVAEQAEEPTPETMDEDALELADDEDGAATTDDARP